MPILALANSKGGGGKSTIAACIAAELHRRKKPVSMLDADPQETLTRWHGNAGPLGQIPIHTDATEAAAEWAERNSKDGILIIDSAGSATRTLAAILRVADVVLIPCRASPLDAEGAMNTMGLLQEYRRTPVSVGVVLNATGRTVLVEHIRNELKAAGMSVMKTQIGQRIAFAEAQLHGSAPCWMGKSAQKASSEIKALTSELIHFLKS